LGTEDRLASTARKDLKRIRPAGGLAAMVLDSDEITPVSRKSIDSILLHRAVLSFKAHALARLIDDLLKGERRSAENHEAPLARLRLPGDNPDDALRYLLRGLGDELKLFSSILSSASLDTPAASQRLRGFEQIAGAVAQAFAVAPATGSGGAIVAMIGDLFERTGLGTWPDFLARTGHGLLPMHEGSKGFVVDGVAEGLGSKETPAPVEAVVAATAGTGTGTGTASRDPGSRGLAQPSPEQAPVQRKEPAPAPVDDLLEIPLILVRPLQGDWGRALFKKGLAYLTKVYDEPPEELRPLLGTWIAQSGNDHQKVFHLLAEAQTQKEPDPKTWVSNVLREYEGVQSPA
jgi:hypothetical protein